MRKQYRVLHSDDAVNEDLINKFAKEGFVISFVMACGAPYVTHWVVYMERWVEGNELALDMESQSAATDEAKS